VGKNKERRGKREKGRRGKKREEGQREKREEERRGKKREERRGRQGDRKRLRQWLFCPPFCFVLLSFPFLLSLSFPSVSQFLPFSWLTLFPLPLPFLFPFNLSPLFDPKKMEDDIIHSLKKGCLLFLPCKPFPPFFGREGQASFSLLTSSHPLPDLSNHELMILITLKK